MATLTDGAHSQGPQEHVAVASRTTTRPVTKPVAVADSVVHGALALLSTQPLTWAAALLTATMGPRLLGADALGQVTMAGMVASIGATVTGLGISEFLVRRVAQRPDSVRRDIGIAVSIQTVTALVGAALIALVAGLTANSLAVAYPLLLVSLVPMLLAPAQTVLLSTFRGREQHQRYAWFNAAGTVLGAVCSTLVLVAGGDVVAASATYGAMLVLTTFVGWKLSGLRPVFRAQDSSLLTGFNEFIRGGLPFVSWQLTQLAYSQIDRLLLGFLVPAAEVGWYAAANRIVGMSLFIPTLIITPLFPALSRSAQEPEVLRRTIAQTLRVILLLTVPLSAGTIVIAPMIPTLFGWPADFEQAVIPMGILAVQLPLVSIGMVLGSVLMAIGRESRLVIIAGVVTAFNIGANLIIIPIAERVGANGAIGASSVTVASEILMLVGALTLVPRRLLDIRTIWDAARIVIGGFATAMVGSALLPTGFVVGVLAAAVTYVVVIALLRAVTVDDLRLVTARFAQKVLRRTE